MGGARSKIGKRSLRKAEDFKVFHELGISIGQKVNFYGRTMKIKRLFIVAERGIRKRFAILEGKRKDAIVRADRVGTKGSRL